MWQIWEFAFKIASISWENCENLLSEVGGMMLMENLSICVFQSFQRWVKMVLMKNVTKSEYLFSKSEYCWRKMWEFAFRDGWEYCWWKIWAFVIWMDGSDRKSEYIFRDKCCWWKMLAFVFYLVFKMVVPLSTQLPSSPCSFYTLVWNKVSSSWKFSLSIFRFYCLITKYSRAALVPGLRSGVNGVLRKLF